MKQPDRECDVHGVPMNRLGLDETHTEDNKPVSAWVYQCSRCMDEQNKDVKQYVLLHPLPKTT